MIICAYQFPLSANIRQNMDHIRISVGEAARQSARLLILPECALTGYPGDDPKMIEQIDFDEAKTAIRELETLSSEHALFIVCGTVEQKDDAYFNCALLFTPKKAVSTLYRKRALWGWDIDHFSAGIDDSGIATIDGFRIGVRICYEIRFPEYFRELYRQKVDCAVVLFCDGSEEGSPERYDLIRAHLRTRAVENIIPLVCVNTCTRYQTAPSAAINEDGKVIAELPCHEEGFLIYDLQKQQELSFSAKGRKFVLDSLVKD